MCGHHNGPSQAELRTGQRVVRKEGCLLELSSGPRIGDRDPPIPVLVPRTPRTLGDLASPLYLETCAGQSLEGFKGCCLKVGVGGESEREVTQDCSPLGFSVHGILQARILEWVAISFSRESSRPRDQTQGSNPCLLHCRQTL